MTPLQKYNPTNLIKQGLHWITGFLGITHSLRRRITIVFITFLAVTLFFGGGLIGDQAYRAQRDLVLERQQLLATDAALQIASFIHQLEGELRVLASAGNGELAYTQDFLDEALTIEPTFLELIAVNTGGDIILNAAQEEAEMTQIQSIRQARWFQVARDGHGYSGDLQISAITREPFIILAHPIKYNGRTTGVLAARIDMSIVWEVVRDIKIGETGVVYIINRDDKVISHPDLNFVFANTDLSENSNFEHVLAAVSNQSFDFIGLNNKPVVGAITDVPGTEWRVITELPKEEAFRPINQGVFNYFVIMAVVLVLAGWALRALVQRMSGPLVELSIAASEFGDSRFAVTLPGYDNPDEMGRLVTSVRRMMSRVTNLTMELQEQVHDRTEELALASEIRKRITQMHNLDEMLVDAVELIRETFNLYHAQIYLMDDLGENLILQASTGVAGQLLLQRKHQLVVDGKSINGAAVVTKTPIVVPDAVADPLFYPNPLLPDTRSEMALPLILGNQVLGVLDVQSDKKEQLCEDNVLAFATIANQLAVAINNARLIENLAHARGAVEAFARRMAHQGWQEFLDFFTTKERVGFVFDKERVVPFTDGMLDHVENVYEQPIEVVGQPIGKIVVENGHSLSNEDREVLHRISDLLAQQVENFRLLAETDRYREEAELAIQRLTQKGWQAFQKDLQTRGFVFDNRELKPVDDRVEVDLDVVAEKETAVVQPISVQGVEIGKLAVEKPAVDKEIAEKMVTAVARQLSSHIENLRLSAQTQDALSKTEQQAQELLLINKVVAKVSTTTDLQEALTYVAEELVTITGADHCGIAQLTEDEKHLRVIADYGTNPTFPSSMGITFPIVGNTSTEQAISTRKTLIVENAQNNPITAALHEAFRERNINTLVIIPMIAGNEVIGTLGLDICDPAKRLTPEQIRLAETIVLQATTAANNIRLFEQTQRALSETATLYEGGAKINEAQKYEDLIWVLRHYTTLGLKAQHISINYFDKPWQESSMPTTIDVLAYDSVGKNRLPTTHYSVDVFPEIVRILRPDQPIVVENIEQSDLLEAFTKKLFLKEFDSKGVVFVPLSVGGKWLGFITLLFKDDVKAGENDLRRIMAFASQIAVSLQTMRLLDETNRLYQQEQARLQREQVLRQIAAHVRSSTNVELVLQTAVKEIGKALGRETFVVLDVENEDGQPNGSRQDGSPRNGSY